MSPAVAASLGGKNGKTAGTIFATVRMPVGAGSLDLPPPLSKRPSLRALRKFPVPRPFAPAKSLVLIFPPTGPSIWRMSAGPHADSLRRGCSKSRKTTRSSMPRPPKDPSGCAFRAERPHILAWCDQRENQWSEQVGTPLPCRFESCFMPPFLNRRMVAAEQDFGNFPAFVFGGARVVRMVEYAGGKRILLG